MTVRGPRHRVEARRIPPQVLAQDLGPWPPLPDQPRWHYDRENAPPPVPGAGQNEEIHEPVDWHREAEEVQQLGPRPHRIIPDPPARQGGGARQPVPGPLRAIPEPPEWNFRLDAGIPYDDGLDAMLGM